MTPTSRTPTVTVCIPTYNGEAHLEETLSSVLAQTTADIEILIHDDGSTDGTVAIAERCTDPRVTLVRSNQNRGAAENWNAAVHAARGEYVKVLCQDDVLRPECIEVELAAIESSERCVIVGARRDIVDDSGSVLIHDRGWKTPGGEFERGVVVRELVRAGTNIVGEPSIVLFRRSAFLRAGGFVADQAFLIDIALWVRILEHGTLVYVPKTLGTFRASLHSWSARLEHEQAVEHRNFLTGLWSSNRRHTSRLDLWSGLTKATVIALGRRTVYRIARRRARRSSAASTNRASTGPDSLNTR